MGSVAVLLVGLAWIMLPGLVLGAGFGLRGWLLAGAAPALTAGFAAGAAVLLTTLGIRWGPAAVAVVLGVVTAVVVAVGAAAAPWRRRRTGGERPGPENPWTWWQQAGIAAGLLLAAAGGLRSTWAATGGLQDVSQTWDAFFHAGAIRLIVETGDVDPAALGAISAQASTHFFAPNTYHAIAALVATSTGQSAVVVINALAALQPLLLGLGVVALLRVTTGRAAHAFCGAAFSGSVAVVPFHMVGYGALFPFGMTLVMLPGAVALVAALLRRQRVSSGLAAGVAVAGLLNAHPQVALLAVIIGVCQFGWYVGTERRVTGRLWAAIGAAVVAASVLSASVLSAQLSAAATSTGIDWPASTTPGGAVGDLFLFNTATRYPQWWFVPLLLVGVVTTVRGDPAALRPYVAAGAVLTGLYVLAAGYDGPVSLAVTSFWWNDRHRFAAAFGILAILFAAAGAVRLRDLLVDRARPHLPRLTESATRLLPAAALATGMALFFTISNGGYAAATENAVAAGYDDGPTLSAAERAGLAGMAEVVRRDGGGAVMNDPNDGCGWAYALEGVQMVFPTPLTGPFDWANSGYDRMRLYDDFDRLDDDAQIQRDVAGVDVRWAVLCTGFIRDWQTRIPGLEEVAHMRSAEVAYSNGAVTLYRVRDPAQTPTGP